MDHPTPEYFRSAIIYEVFPRNHGPNHNFTDVVNDLERIKNLSVDILWIMPHYPIGVSHRKGKNGSPYAIKNYRQVHPDLGTIEEFENLVNAAHNIGLKLMIDIVFNHTSCDSDLLKDHPDWFLQNKYGNPDRKVADWSDVYDLDFTNLELQDYLVDVLEFWAAKGVDGFRCDVAPLIPLSFWLKARKKLNKHYNLIWLAESVHRSFVKSLRQNGYTCHSDPELHQVFDLTYDYDGFEILESCFTKNQSIGKYLDYMEYQETLYPANALKLRFLENHDNPRIASRFVNLDYLKNWTIFGLMRPGANLIYAGQEYADPNLPDIFEQQTYVTPLNKEFYNWFKRVLKISKMIKADCRDWQIKEVIQGIVQIDWWNDQDSYCATVNLANIPPENIVLPQVCGEELIMNKPLLNKDSDMNNRVGGIVKMNLK